MSLCINPSCLQPDHPENDRNDLCQSCGGLLILQGRYRVMRELSNNTGFGTVYEAYERNIPKILKVLRRDRARDPKVLALFHHEAAVLSHIRHPGVPYVAEDGDFTVLLPESQELLHCIIMEKIDGLNLRQWMQQQGNHPISEQQAIQWLTQLTDILQRIHQQNYFHRDIKPDNVMLRANGQVVLVDFGAAREMTVTYLAQVKSQGGITQISSAGYTPPEQEQGQAVPQSDFYALGRTLIYLLTALSPNDSAIYDPLTNHFDWRPHAPQVSDDLAQLLNRLIAPRVVDRPPTAQAILDTLNQLALGRWSAAGDSASAMPDYTFLPSEGTSVMMKRFRPALGMIPGVRIHRRLVVAAMLVGLGAIATTGLWWRSHLATESAVEIVAPADLPTVTTRLQRTLPGHTSSVNALGLLSDGGRILSASADKSVLLWDLSTGQVLHAFRDQPSFVNGALLSPDETILYSVTAAGTLQAIDIDSGAPRWEYTAAPTAFNVLARTPDGQQIMTGGADGTIHIVKAQTGELLRTLSAHQGAVNTLAVTADGQALISGGSDRHIYIWALATGELQQTLRGHDSFVNYLLVSLDGRYLFSASADKTVRQWDLTTGQVLRTLKGHRSYVNVLALSRDGQTLSSGSADETVVIWDIATGKPLTRLTGFAMTIDHLVLATGNRVVTASRTTSVIKVWTADQ